MTILPALERDLLAAARQRVPQTGGAGDGKPPRRSPFGILAPIAAVAVVVVVAIVFLAGTHGHDRAPAAGGASRKPVTVEFVADTLDGKVVARAAAVLRARLRDTFGAARLTTVGNQITVLLPNAPTGARTEIAALGASGRLELYDWEADAVTPAGKTVAVGLQAQDPAALQLSQGSGSAAPGAGGAGGLSLYQAVALASRQPAQRGPGSSRGGPEFFMFGTPGSRPCATAPPGVHCLLAGPVENRGMLLAPRGVSSSAGQVLEVPQGTVVLEATSPSFTPAPDISAPSARFFVLRDRPALPPGAVIHPSETTNQGGQAAVSFGFTGAGGGAFQALSANVARRGARVSHLGLSLQQHFAVAFGNELVSVPSVDFRTYPDGIAPGDGAEIEGGFTAASAKLLATLLRHGPLPVALFAP